MCDKDGIPNPKCHILPGNKWRKLKVYV
jgi:hypothetical protein